MKQSKETGSNRSIKNEYKEAAESSSKGTKWGRLGRQSKRKSSLSVPAPQSKHIPSKNTATSSFLSPRTMQAITSLTEINSPSELKLPIKKTNHANVATPVDEVEMKPVVVAKLRIDTSMETMKQIDIGSPLKSFLSEPFPLDISQSNAG